MHHNSNIQSDKPLRVLLSGGGTGGHIFPAIAIADEIKARMPDTEFLFVGAIGRMEMELVPKAGYSIQGLWISGLQRRITMDNASFPFKVLHSLWNARRIIRDFKPDIAIGTGGYAGAPALYAAARMGSPTVIQEPNAFAGLANRWLGKRVDCVCVAFPGMEKFFPKNKIVITGNPVREEMLDNARKESKSPAIAQPHVLLMGGSGGAKSLNEAMRDNFALIKSRPEITWTWQCGKHYLDAFKSCPTAQLSNVFITDFLDGMDKAYSQADIVIARAGSTTIAELQYLGKPSILVPSPWVAEDHQRKNAKALQVRKAAILIEDTKASTELVSTVFMMIDDKELCKELAQNCATMAEKGAVGRIVDEALRLITLRHKIHAS